MDRRSFISRVASAVGAAPFVINAQTPSKVWQIGFLREGTNPIDPYFWVVMREFGWIQGQNVILEPRYASIADHLSVLAAELVQLTVDLIVALGNPASRAAQAATRTIPVLFIVALDP